MLELPHTLAGIAIAVSFPHPLVALPLSLGSHFLLDLVPHWDPDVRHASKNTLFLLFLDSFSALVFGLFVAYIYQSPLVIVCAFLAVLPDLISIPHFLFKKPDWAKHIVGWQRRIHNNTSLIPGIITQLILTIICLQIIF